MRIPLRVRAETGEMDPAKERDPVQFRRGDV
jgi:hypothetical protein